jgi:predicted NBD/HSP70 family sugar kinase
LTTKVAAPLAPPVVARMVATPTAWAVDVDHHPDGALDTCAELAQTLLGQAGIPAQRLLGAGVAISAPLYAGAGGFASTSIFADWAGIDVAQALTTRLGCPAQLGNDANLGALAEATFGAGRGIDNLVYVMLSAGVGAGLLLNGKLFQGHTGTAGELATWSSIRTASSAAAAVAAVWRPLPGPRRSSTRWTPPTAPG